MSDPIVIEQVREHYAELARKALAQRNSGCCGSSQALDCCASTDTIPASALAAIQDNVPLPTEVIQTSLGCGTPLELAQLQPGETVLDLGSGGGLDCFYAAKLVGPGGHVIGVDMTPEMLALAATNRAKVGLENVEFRRGYLEALPVDDATVDVIISNCVINLSSDKDAVFGEAFRVLKPGGRVAFSDVVARVELTPELQEQVDEWAACAAGAIPATAYIKKMERAGFVDIAVSGTANEQDLTYSARFTGHKPDAR